MRSLVHPVLLPRASGPSRRRSLLRTARPARGTKGRSVRRALLRRLLASVGGLLASVTGPLASAPGLSAFVAGLLAIVLGLGLLAPRVAHAAEDFDHGHKALAAILRPSVADGKVDYDQVKKQLPGLNAYLETLAKTRIDQLATFSRAQRLAFWINGYNARVLQLVARAYPVASIQDIPGAFKTQTFTLAGKELTLDKLENDIIRAQFQEPRIHFALNCAARSCPPLRPEPFVGERLEQQLEAAAADFVRDTHHNRINLGQKVVYLSRIFEWFGQDFIPKYGDGTPRGGRILPKEETSEAGRSVSNEGEKTPEAGRSVLKEGEKTAREGLTPEQAATLNFIARYVEGEKTRALLTTGTPKVGYFEYDWALNVR